MIWLLEALATPEILMLSVERCANWEGKLRMPTFDWVPQFELVASSGV